MTQTDIDAPAALLKKSNEARTPWESINPNEPVRFVREMPAFEHSIRQDIFEPINRSVSTAPLAVETEAALPFLEFEAPALQVVERLSPIEVHEHQGSPSSDTGEHLVPSSVLLNDDSELVLCSVDDSTPSGELETAELIDEVPAPQMQAPTSDALSINPPQDAAPPMMAQTPWTADDAHAPTPTVVPAVLNQNAYSDVAATLPAHAATNAAVTFATADTVVPDVSKMTIDAQSLETEYVEPAMETDVLIPVATAMPMQYAATMPATFTERQTQAETELELEVDAEFAGMGAAIGGGWTIPIMCLGIGLIACCMVIPQSDFNRRLSYEHQQLISNLESVQKQVAVNDEFLKKVMDDPTLAERLASRQMKTIRKGQQVLHLAQSENDAGMSPFIITEVAAPESPLAYQPMRGTIPTLCNNPQSRLYLLGTAMTLVAGGLVMGFGPTKATDRAD